MAGKVDAERNPGLAGSDLDAGSEEPEGTFAHRRVAGLDVRAVEAAFAVLSDRGLEDRVARVRAGVLLEEVLNGLREEAGLARSSVLLGLVGVFAFAVLVGVMLGVLWTNGAC